MGRERNAALDAVVEIFGQGEVHTVPVTETGFKQGVAHATSSSAPVLWVGECEGADTNQFVIETCARNRFLQTHIREGGCDKLWVRNVGEFSVLGARISRNAGDYYCNRAAYEMLFRQPRVRNLFVHVPRNLVVDKNVRQDFMKLRSLQQRA